MIALLFEVLPRLGQQDRYLEVAASLKPALERNGGLLFLDRYTSLTRERVLLSHQIWIDEASLTRWRANGQHYDAQTSGRNAVFEDYRLRVGPVIAEGGEGGGVVPQTEGLAYNDPLNQSERFVVIARSHTRLVADGEGGEGYRSVYRDGEHVWIGEVPDRPHGYEALRRIAADPCTTAAQLCLVSRDYSLDDRREAPQYFPDRVKS